MHSLGWSSVEHLRTRKWGVMRKTRASPGHWQRPLTIRATIWIPALDRIGQVVGDRLHRPVGPIGILPRVNQGLVTLADEAVGEDGIVVGLADPHEPQAVLAARPAPALDECFAKFSPFERAAVVDELGHADHLPSDAQVVGGDIVELVHPVVRVDDAHGYPVTRAGPSLSSKGRASQKPVADPRSSAILDKYKDRVVALRVKDIGKLDPNPHKATMVAVGEGTIDWKKVISTARAHGVKHYFYEQEEPSTRPIMESAEMSADYLSKLTV